MKTHKINIAKPRSARTIYVCSVPIIHCTVPDDVQWPYSFGFAQSDLPVSELVMVLLITRVVFLFSDFAADFGVKIKITY